MESKQRVTFYDLEAELEAKKNKENIGMPLSTEFDIPTAIETVWTAYKSSSHANIASFDGPTSAWSVIDIRGQFVAVPKTVNDNNRGTIFAIDFYKNNYLGSTLNATVKLDHQPCCIFYYKNFLFVGTSHPTPSIHVLDGHLFMQTARI